MKKIYKNYDEWQKSAGIGEIYSGEGHSTVVKQEDANGEVEEYPVQIYSDGYCNFYYGIDFHGVALYYEMGAWIPYEKVEDPAFPNFVELAKNSSVNKKNTSSKKKLNRKKPRRGRLQASASPPPPL